MKSNLHNTRNDLPASVRRKVITLLNQHLADAADLQSQAKQAHWNVKGPNFIALHELFDKVAGEAAGHVDELAERITALGGTAFGTVRHAAAGSRLKPYPELIVSGRDHVRALADALATFGRSVRVAIDESAKLSDADTADLFTEISRAADKQLWFVEAHLQASN